MTSIEAFFDACLGKWSIERTYHYLSDPEGRVERSHTNYDIQELTADRRQKVLADNNRPSEVTGPLYGFFLAFDTLSDRGEAVAMDLNILFVPTHTSEDGIIEGDYLRDRAYEESRPMISHFRYDPERAELRMITRYTRVVSVDSITLVNPELRIRQIQNFRRNVLENLPLQDLELVGFGVEKKVT
ncbi:phycobiliprotein lyase [Gloeobacter kilaueensis]|uniref:Chromophore lyase CpcS/CpeS n=1 Tax=Gloeobacter kilaueensis (strain ATCC BAA-2537 / CCAP 1431/1 / ULC 316 / JS1) TaxID=1183438 RepID=U5QP77_GLOK1|nr:phycobiliprotein lyase [Gloeobacter kilaueensis]AGY59374.1 hypothetical protein GKIL_3128 [Gloeobacter kilaueensis JS1]